MTFRKWVALQGNLYFPSDFTDFDWNVRVHETVLQRAHAISRKDLGAKATEDEA